MPTGSDESHCWKDRLEYIMETHGEYSDEYNDYIMEDDSHSMCLLPDGHDGPHEWAPTSGITLEFVDGREEEEVPE